MPKQCGLNQISVCYSNQTRFDNQPGECGPTVVEVITLRSEVKGYHIQVIENADDEAGEAGPPPDRLRTIPLAVRKQMWTHYHDNSQAESATVKQTA